MRIEPDRSAVRPGNCARFANWSGLYCQIQVCLAADEGGDLAGGVQYLVDPEILDRRPALRVGHVVAVEPLQVDLPAAIDASNAIGPGADGLLRIGSRSDFLPVCLPVDRQHHGKILERCREHAFHPEAHLPVVQFLDASDEAEIAGHHRLGIVQDRIDRIDHVIGAEGIAVVKHHAITQREVERRRIAPFPFGGQRRHDLEIRGIAIDQRVPGLVRDDQAGARGVAIRIDIGDGIPPDDARGIVRLLRPRRLMQCRQRCAGRGCARQFPSFHASSPLRPQSSPPRGKAKRGSRPSFPIYDAVRVKVSPRTLTRCASRSDPSAASL